MASSTDRTTTTSPIEEQQQQTGQISSSKIDRNQQKRQKSRDARVNEKVEVLPRKKAKVEQEEAEMLQRIDPPKNLKLTVKNGIRYLEPYWGCYKGYAKNRWIGRAVCEVFNNEFTSVYHPLYAKAAIRRGRVFINGHQMTDPEYKFRISDRFVHINHRHETEIPALPIQFIHETDDFLVINKPPGLPVHPCGNYNIHSVMSLLKREYGREDSDKLRPLFRLDRNTTGVLMFAKNYSADLKFKNAIQERKLRKEYIVKVEGQFPEGDEIVCQQPIGVLSLATGIRLIRADGQEALSRFRLVHFDPVQNTSLVSCKIETGRTHQIRIHLQYLGYPVVNDNIYNDLSWGPLKGKGGDFGGKTMEQLIEDVGNRHSKKRWIYSSDTDYERRIREMAENEGCDQIEEYNIRKLDLHNLPSYDPMCWNCAVIEKREMTKEDWEMPLHCFRYSGDGWSFEAPLPEWAKYPQENTTATATVGLLAGLTPETNKIQEDSSNCSTIVEEESRNTLLLSAAESHTC